MQIKVETNGQEYIEIPGFVKDKPKCPICQDSELVLQNTIAELPEFMPSIPKVPSVRVPVAVFVCEKCGRIELFSAIFLKITDENGRLLLGEKSRAGGE
jgi:hypothetical protein